MVVVATRIRRGVLVIVENYSVAVSMKSSGYNDSSFTGKASTSGKYILLEVTNTTHILRGSWSPAVSRMYNVYIYMMKKQLPDRYWKLRCLNKTKQAQNEANLFAVRETPSYDTHCEKLGQTTYNRQYTQL